MNDGGNIMYVNALTGGGTLHNTGTLHIGMNNGSGTFGGIMDNGGSLVKHGTGTETLSGANAYGGSTTIENGTLMVGANAPSGAAGAGQHGAGRHFGRCRQHQRQLEPLLADGRPFHRGPEYHRRRQQRGDQRRLHHRRRYAQ